MKLLSLLVFRSGLGDCTANGISASADYIYIPCEEGPTDSKDIDPSLIFIPEKRGTDYWALKPIVKKEGLIGPMSGGNLAYSSDDRCAHIYHIHDRFETQACYDSNWI